MSARSGVPVLRLLLVIATATFTSACLGSGDVDPVPDNFSCDDALNQLDQEILVPDAPPYEEWLLHTSTRTSDGTWVFEGDILIYDESTLRGFYLEQYLDPEAAQDSASYRSTVQCLGKEDLTWVSHEKLNLTYCFGDFESTKLREATRGALRLAARAWERAM